MSIKFGIKPQARVPKPSLQVFDDDLEEEEAVPMGIDAHAAAEELREAGNQLAAASQFGLALNKWDQALRHTPDSAPLHELRAQAFLQIGEDWKAVQSATRATELQPAWPDGFLTLARAQFNFGEPEAALVSMQRVIQLQPENEEAQQEIGQIQMLVLQRSRLPPGELNRVLVSKPP